MKQVIEEILKEEKAARDRVSEAREEAKKIRLEAENAARQQELNVREAAMQESKELLQDAEKKAEKEKEATLKNASEDVDGLWISKKAVIEKHVDALFQLIFSRDAG